MRILVIEDDTDLCELLAIHLEKEGYQVDCCSDGVEGLRYGREQVHDAIVLDWMLPELDGLSLLKRLRAEKIAVPVLLMTALGSVPQVIEGLDSGADDYIVKPFAMGEVLARLRALTRRPAAIALQGEKRFGDTLLDSLNKTLATPTHRCTLSLRETQMLELFFRSPEKTLPRSTIFSYVWGMDAPVEEANLDNYIHFIRDRLQEVHSGAKITTVRGVGYRLEKTGV